MMVLVLTVTFHPTLQWVLQLLALLLMLQYMTLLFNLWIVEALLLASDTQPISDTWYTPNFPRSAMGTAMETAMGAAI